MSSKYAFVMMIRDKWWNEFRHRQKDGKQVHSYVKRSLAPPKQASLILFYVTKPVAELAGFAQFIERKTGDVSAIWKEHGRESVLNSKEKYEEFVKNQRKVSFIRFKDLHEAAKPIPLKDFLLFLGVKRLARGGFYLDQETTEDLITQMEDAQPDQEPKISP